MPFPGSNGFLVAPVRHGNFVRPFRDGVKLDATNFCQRELSHPSGDLSVFIIELFCPGPENYDKHEIGTVSNWVIAVSSITHAIRPQAASKLLRLPSPCLGAQSRLLIAWTL